MRTRILAAAAGNAVLLGLLAIWAVLVNQYA